MGWFPSAPDKTGAMGSLVQHTMYIPSDTMGAILYFSCKDLSHELVRVENAGGIIIQAKEQICEGHGFMALIKDTEGNRIALHSQNKQLNIENTCFGPSSKTYWINCCPNSFGYIHFRNFVLVPTFNIFSAPRWREEGLSKEGNLPPMGMPS